MALCFALLIAGTIADATVSPAQIAVARARLECILAGRLLTRVDAEADRLGKQRRLNEAQSIRAGLNPATDGRLIGVADQEIAERQAALANATRRVAELDNSIAATRRAIASLILPPPSPSLYDQARSRGNVALANAFNCGEPPERNRMGDLSLPARLFIADFCGQRLNRENENIFGISRNPALIARLNRIVAQLNRVSANTPIHLLRDCPEDSGGAFSTSSSSYLGECALIGRSDEEIAFVIAHERAHVSMQHVSLTSIERMRDRTLNGRLAEGVRSTGVTALSILARLGDFDRDQEYEADLVGAETMMAAGFSPHGIDQTITRWSRLEDEVERDRIAGMSPGERAIDPGDSARRAVLQLIVDHPSAAERRAALEAALGAHFWDMDPATMHCRAS